MTLPVVFEVDYAQPRISVPRIAVVARGDLTNAQGGSRGGWDADYSSNVWQDPITKTIMLRPACLIESFHSSNAGIYAKLAKSDFGFTDAAAWEEFTLKSGAGVYLRGVGDTTANTGITSAPWGENRGIFISYYAYNVGNEEFIQFSGGFGADAVGTDDKLNWTISAGGQVVVYWGSTRIGGGALNGSSKEYTRDAPSSQKSGKYVDFIVLPFRGREVLFYSPTEGGGFSVVLPDVDEGDLTPEIIRTSDKLWFKIVTGQALVQVAKMSFASSGYICSTPYKFNRVPSNPIGYSMAVFQDESSLANVISSSAATLRNVDNSAAYSSGDDVRLRIDLTSSSNKSPFIMAAVADWDTEITETSESGLFEFQHYCSSGSLSIPDSHENIEFSYSVSRALDAQDDGYNRIAFVSNRPVRVRTGDIVVFEGLTEPAEWADSANESAIVVAVKCRSLWKLLEEFVFDAPMPLDGLSLEAAIIKILTTAGIPPAKIECSTSFFTIPSVPATSEQFNFECEYHERASEALNRLMDTYAADWLILEYPDIGGVKFWIVSPDELPNVPGLTIYPTTADAITGGVPSADAWQVLYRDYQERSLDPEANEITVVGYDLRESRPIIAVDRNSESQNAQLDPWDRPQNWCGYFRPYEFRHSMMTTLPSVERARDILAKRLFPRRYVAEFTTELLLQTDDIPIWRGYLIDIYGYDDARVMSLHVDFVLDDPDSRDFYWRPTRYVAQYVGEENTGISTRTIGTTVEEIKASFDLRLLQQRALAGAAKIISGPPIKFSPVPP